MKKIIQILLTTELIFFFSFYSSAQPGSRIYDSAKKGIVITNNTSASESKVLSLAPAISFNEHPINHNMHITSDGDFYYTINGGSSGSGQINKFTPTGTLLQTYPILIDGRGLSHNSADGFLYASLYAGDIVRIDDLSLGTYTTMFSTIMQNAQASFAISPDGSKFYNFFQGTCYVHDFTTGAIIDTVSGLMYGSGNFGGEAAVAVDDTHIYTVNATIKTVYTYDMVGNLLQTDVLDSGDNGHSLAIANGLLFFSTDGNYNIGTWYGYDLTGSTGTAAEVSNITDIKIYPNPTSGKVTVEGHTGSVEVYNMNGQMVYQDNSESFFRWLELSELSRGTYLMRLKRCDVNENFDYNITIVK